MTKQVQRNFRQYEPTTGKFVRHKVYRGGRKAFSSIIQFHDKFNGDTFHAVEGLNRRMYLAEKVLSMINDTIRSVVMNPANNKGKPQ